MITYTIIVSAIIMSVAVAVVAVTPEPHRVRRQDQRLGVVPEALI